jgi:hypothetical protein
MEGIESERVFFVLIELFTGGKFHINLNNIIRVNLSITAVKQIKSHNGSNRT